MKPTPVITGEDLARVLWKNEGPASIEDLGIAFQKDGESLADGRGEFTVTSLSSLVEAKGGFGLWWLVLRRGGTLWEVDSEDLEGWEKFLEDLQSKGLTPRELVGATIELVGPGFEAEDNPTKFRIGAVRWERP
ncbi:MAG: hypothetical protein WAN74_05935 [Thermoplasmata archaeon]